MAGYNGWTNWETWNVAIWLDNEYPLYRDKVRFVRSNHLTKASVRAYCESVFPDGTPDMRGDDKEPAAEQMAKVDWTELTAHFIEEAKEYAR